ncbi:MAG: response regulator transcription factor [Chloroflexi bacterium]|nr:response regulator transcription factor [Chloroflexota bacterium]
MTEGPLILVVDDEPGMLDVVQMYLAREGFRVALADDGQAALAAVEKEMPDLIILDLMLPKVDGLEVCRRLRRASDVPIIMLTARDEDVDKIVGLELGADDYVTKPFNPRELAARAKAVLRRRAAAPQAPSPETALVGSLTISRASRTAAVSGQPLELTLREFELLWILADHPGQAFERERLIELAWGYEFPGGTRTVDMHVAQLRKKLAAANAHDLTITTLQSVGYRLDVG